MWINVNKLSEHNFKLLVQGKKATHSAITLEILSQFIKSIKRSTAY